MIGLIIIFTTFIFLFRPGQVADFDSISWRTKAYYAVKSLDDSNDLRKFILANDSVSIKNRLSGLIPELNFEVTICKLDCPKPSLPSQTITSFNYIIAGDLNDLDPRQVVVYMWSE